MLQPAFGPATLRIAHQRELKESKLSAGASTWTRTSTTFQAGSGWSTGASKDAVVYNTWRIADPGPGFLTSVFAYYRSKRIAFSSVGCTGGRADEITASGLVPLDPAGRNAEPTLDIKPGPPAIVDARFSASVPNASDPLRQPVAPTSLDPDRAPLSIASDCPASVVNQIKKAYVA